MPQIEYQLALVSSTPTFGSSAVTPYHESVNEYGGLLSPGRSLSVSQLPICVPVCTGSAYVFAGGEIFSASSCATSPTLFWISAYTIWCDSLLPNVLAAALLVKPPLAAATASDVLA